MSGYLPRLSLVPSFPEYTGPYKVGTIDVEAPVANIPSSTESPDPRITTLRFRIFYPCESPSQTPKPVRWLPSPQRAVLGAYARFLGAGPYSATAFSYLPNAIYRTVIPALRDAPLKPAPTSSGKWPVMVFSHGLGGNRNSYSHIPGSLASHGLVVIAPEHRDGSAPITHIRASPATEKAGNDLEETDGDAVRPKRAVDYVVIPHRPGRDVEDGRNLQLRIRCWELGLVYETLLKMDRGEQTTHLGRPVPRSSLKPDNAGPLSMFADALDVDRPGSIIWGGHSFGSATVVQFVKSVFYGPWAETGNEHRDPADHLFFTPPATSDLARQITPSSPLVLLDPWAMPLTGSSSCWLWKKPLPTHAAAGPGGSNVLAILSEEFFKWSENLKHTRRMLASSPYSTTSPSEKQQGVLVFYPVGSAHLSQSDFGVLFPWVTKRLCNAQDPERTLRLNVRATLQMLRERGYEVAPTSRMDQEEPELAGDGDEARHDRNILAPGAQVRGWVAINISEEDDEDSQDEKRPDRTPSETVGLRSETIGELLESKA